VVWSFSEGKQTALGFAIHFTEASLDASQSALGVDDPATSLEHIRRAKVAAPPAAPSQSRQVVVFTQEVAFVAELKTKAEGLGAGPSTGGQNQDPGRQLSSF
jgi:wobble nucleotide-excising tRNase